MYLRSTNLTNFQSQHVRQKVMANKETHKHKIIDKPFKVDLEWSIYNFQILTMYSRNTHMLRNC
jgi:hypothetical protein